ncbi:Geranylgeranyl pyrophosphate synthase [Nowakowskiella sp. JEL0407]|nr:Geranylgeranyl pyrophosphate synthase [Nowakowskiella sp. JEL0407]
MDKTTFVPNQRPRSQVLLSPSPTDAVLLEPFTYLAAHPGKEMRTRLIQAFNLWINVPPEKLSVIVEVVEMLHMASLLIDDIEDESTLRRGFPVAHNIFGTPITINCANFVYFLALEKLLTLKQPRAVEIFTEELISLHRGQGCDIYWRDSVVVPTEEEYMEMVKNKTGGLLRLAVKLLQVCGNADKDYVNLVNNLGVHFQIRDDYINLVSTNFADTKGFAEDLTEGKFSYVILHCIRSDPENHQMINILKRRSTDIELKKYAIELMKRTHSFVYTRHFLMKIEQQARDQIAELGGNNYLDEYLNYLRKEYEKPAPDA